jgi:hypothetical protein
MFLHDVAFFLRKRCEVRSNPIEDHKSALEGTLVLGYSKLISQHPIKFFHSLLTILLPYYYFFNIAQRLKISINNRKLIYY